MKVGSQFTFAIMFLGALAPDAKPAAGGGE